MGMNPHMLGGALWFALADLEGGRGTLADGVHLAAAAGAWLAVVAGFGGYALRDGQLTLSPRLPPGVDRLGFRLRFRGSLLEVAVDGDGTTYRVLDGDGVILLHGDDLVDVPAGGTVTCHTAVATRR